MTTEAKAPVMEAPAAPEKAAKATEPEAAKDMKPVKPEEDDNKMAKSTNEPAAAEEAGTEAAEEEEEEPAPPAKTLFVSNISWKVKEPELKEPFGEHGTVDDCKIVTYWDKSESRIKSKGYGFVTFSSIEEATKALNKMHGEMLQGRDLVVKFSNSTGPKGKTKKASSEEGDEAEQKGEAPEENEGETATKGEPGKRRGRRKKKKKKEGAAETTAEEKQAEAASNVNYRTLIVRSLPFDATQEQVVELFKGIEVQEVEVKRSRRTKANSQRAYAFFTFATHDLAKKALDQSSSLKIGESELSVEVANQQPEDRLKEKAKKAVKKPEKAAPKQDAGEEHGRRKRLFVNGISAETTETSLSARFSKFGPLTKCTVRKGKTADKFAYVNFQQAEHAQKALEATNEESFEGGTLSVQYARSRSRRFRVKKTGSKPQAEA